MKRPPSILILYPYFGSLPEWFDLFHETLLRNADVDFLFFTDVEFDRYAAPNVQHRAMSLSEYAQLCSKKLGINVVLENSYKICDLRPFFGRIHANEINGYDFYGYGDVDLIWGDLRAFYTANLLKKFDVFSTHSDVLSGHFSLFRNTSSNRNLMFNVVEDFEEKIHSRKHCGMDEKSFLDLYKSTNSSLGSSKIPIWKWFRKNQQFRLLLQEQYTTPFIPKPWLDGSINSNQPEQWFYKNGLITNHRDVDRKFMYLHFMNFKSAAFRADGTPAPWQGKDRICFAHPSDMEKGISIGPNGIYPLSEEEC
jgi:hypothetical protein